MRKQTKKRSRKKKKNCYPVAIRNTHSPLCRKTNWPKLLQRIIKVAKSEIQRDIMLMGAFTALGACMSRHVRCLYGDKYHYPSLQCFIVAPSASGKGILSYLRLLVQPIHDEIRAKVAEQNEDL